jgi:hypothetical protein
MSITTRLRVEALESREVPAGDLASAVQLTGLPLGSNLRVAGDLVGNQVVAGTFTGTLDLDPSTTGVTNVVSRGGTDVFVARYGSDGKLVWARSLGGAADESVNDLAFDGSGNVYLGGAFRGAVDFDPDPNKSATGTAAEGGSGYLWKLNFNGNLFWARTIPGASSVSALAHDPAGGVIATGTFKGTIDFDPTEAGTANLVTTNPNGAVFAWRVGSTGTLAWARALSTTGTIEAPAVVVDGSGFVSVGGRLNGTADLDPADATKAQVAAGTYWTPYVVKLNPQGTYLWSKVARTVSAVAGAPNAITGLGVDSIGNVYAAGTYAGTLDFDPSATANYTLASASKSVDGFVWKLGADGGFRWARGFGGVAPEAISDLFVDKAGNAYTAGTFTGVADFDPAPLSTVILVSGSGATDGFILKLSPQGGLNYTRALGGGVSTVKPTAVWANGAGNIVIGGTFAGTADLDPSTVLKPYEGGAGSGFVARLVPAVNTTPGPANRPPMNVSAGTTYVISEGQGLTVKATATDSDKDTLTYTWDLNGDGKFGDAVGPTATLTPAQMKALGLEDGNGEARPVRVRVRDGVNMAAEAVANLVIKDVAPAVKVTAPATTPQGVRPQITTVVTNEPSAADRKAGYKFSYDFNDDGVWDQGDGSTYAGSVSTSTLKVPALFLPNAGPLAVRVRTFDKDGAYTDKVVTIEVKNAAPTATFTMTGTPMVGNPVQFRLIDPKDTANDVQAGFTYAFDFNGDGHYEVTGKNPVATHTFSYLGTFTVRGAVIDQDGAFTVYTLTVVVNR